MGTISKNHTFSAGATIIASEHNSNFDTIYNDYNGSIANVNISATAAIVATKLAQIATANKVTAGAVVGTPWAEGHIVNGFEIAHCDENATGITTSPGLMLHGTTQVKTTASSSALLDTAGNYYDGNLPSFPAKQGKHNYIGIDSSGTMKLLGHAGAPTVMSYTTDGTQGTVVKTKGKGGIPIYFWDSGNTKHWRVIGQVRCYEVGGVVQVYHGQIQYGRTICLDSAIAASGIAVLTSTTWAEINCRSVIAATAMEGMFSVNLVAAGSILEFSTRNADATANPGEPKGNMVHSTDAMRMNIIQTTSSMQAIDYKAGDSSPQDILYVTGYKMNIRL